LLEFHDRGPASTATAAVDAKGRSRRGLLFRRSVQLSVIFFLISVHPTHFPPLAAHQHVRRRRLAGGGRGDGRRRRDSRGGRGGGGGHRHFAVNRDAHRERKKKNGTTRRKTHPVVVDRKINENIFGYFDGSQETCARALHAPENGEGESTARQPVAVLCRLPVGLGHWSASPPPSTVASQPPPRRPPPRRPVSSRTRFADGVVSVEGWGEDRRRLGLRTSYPFSLLLPMW